MTIKSNKTGLAIGASRFPKMMCTDHIIALFHNHNSATVLWVDGRVSTEYKVGSLIESPNIGFYNNFTGTITLEG